MIYFGYSVACILVIV